MGNQLSTTPRAAIRRRLFALWLTVALVSGGLLALSRAGESGLDDPDPAQQRPGFLDFGDLPQPAPRITDGLPRPGRRAIVFFLRPDGVSALCRSLAGSRLRGRADIVVVVSGVGSCGRILAIDDPSSRLALAYGLRRPRAGGAPEGYAVIDGRGRIRYRTLDPTVADELGEVSTILRATP